MAAPKTGITGKKRSDERHGHRTLAEKSQTEIIEVSEGELVPSILNLQPDPAWCQAALDTWTGLIESPLSRFHESSDLSFIWVYSALTDTLIKGRFSAGQLMAWHAMSKDLGVTEIQRRAASIEIQRQGPAVIDTAKVARLNDYRKYLES